MVKNSLVRRKQVGISYLEGGDGLPVFLLHGIPGSAQTWAKVGQRLSHRYRVVIPDLAGFGLSAPPAGDYYMEAQAAQLRALLDALEIDELVLGVHDFGGPVGLTLLKKFPELKVRALVVTATNFFTDTYVPPPLRLASVPVLGTIFFKLVAGNSLGLRLMYRAANKQGLSAPGEHLTPGAIDLTRKIFQRSLADLKTNYRAVESMLPRIQIPTLVLWGDSDPFFSLAVGERTAKAIPGSRLHVLAQTGHFVPEEQPAQVAEEFESFLGGLGFDWDSTATLDG